MQKTFCHFVILFLAFSPMFVAAQVINGFVFDANLNLPIPGATVYQDGSTNVAITDADGKFALNTKGLNNAIIIQFIGYTTKRIDTPLIYKDKVIKLMMFEQLISLDEVIIGKKGPFSRREMLTAFRSQFLGTSQSASQCKILNEDDLILNYNSTKKTLTATARNPLQIRNDYLEYNISFDLDELVVTYRSTESLNAHYIENSYFSGSTYYTDFSKSSKVNKRRLETFYGSTAHLMQALAYGNLEKEKWEIYVDKFKINPATYFEITDTLNYKKVKLIKKPERKVAVNMTEQNSSTKNRFAIGVKIDSTSMISKPDYFAPYYHRRKQSLMEFLTPEIYVDANGNFTPIYGLVFGGHLGSLKAGDLLPIDFFQTIKEMPNRSEN